MCTSPILFPAWLYCVTRWMDRRRRNQEQSIGKGWEPTWLLNHGPEPWYEKPQMRDSIFVICLFAMRLREKEKPQRKENRQRKGHRVQRLSPPEWTTANALNLWAGVLLPNSSSRCHHWAPTSGKPGTGTRGHTYSLSPQCRSSYIHFRRRSTARWWWTHRHWSHGTDMKDTASRSSVGSFVRQVQKTRL